MLPRQTEEETKEENKNEENEKTAWGTYSVDDLYNILPFNCAVIDIRGVEAYNKMHVWCKSKHIPLNLKNIDPQHTDYKRVLSELHNVLSGKSNIVPLRSKVWMSLVVIAEHSDSAERDKLCQFVYSVFSTLKASDDLLEKYEVFVLSQPFDAFYQQYPFYCRGDKDEDEAMQYVHHPNCILSNQLYLGTGRQAHNETVVKNLKISRVVNITKHIECKFQHIKYVQIKVNDEETAQIDTYFEPVLEFIHDALMDDKAEHRVLVHCEMGVSRSASFVLAYLMKYGKMNLCDAYKHVKHCRPIIHPNAGFLRQLVEFEKSIYGETSVHKLVNQRKVNVDQKAANLKLGLLQAIAKKK